MFIQRTVQQFLHMTVLLKMPPKVSSTNVLHFLANFSYSVKYT